MSLRRLAWVLFSLLTVACDSGQRPAPAPAPATTQRTAAPAQVPAAATATPDVEYVERVTGGASAGDRLPMIVALHGLGDEPRSFVSVLDGFDGRARVIAPRAFDAWGDGWSWFPFDKSDSDAQRGAKILAAAERLAPAIERWVRERPTEGRPIITGFSQGGMLSFALATHHPELVRAAFPLSGSLPEPLWPAHAPTTSPRIVALHGDADERVPLGPTKSAVSALEARGWRVELRVFPGVGHQVLAAERRELFGLLREALTGP